MQFSKRIGKNFSKVKQLGISSRKELKWGNIKSKWEMWRTHSSAGQLEMLSQDFSPTVLRERKKYIVAAQEGMRWIIKVPLLKLYATDVKRTLKKTIIIIVQLIKKTIIATVQLFKMIMKIIFWYSTESWVTKATCQELDSGGRSSIKKRDVGYVQDMCLPSYFGTST